MGKHRKPSPAVRVSSIAVRSKPAVEPVTQTIQQQRAAFAFKQVSALVNKEEAGRFRAYANSLPALVQMNGIGQAMAFVFSKQSGKGVEAKGWAVLYQLVSQWLCDNERNIFDNTTFDNKSADLMQALVSHDQACYRLAQVECQALLVWVRQFARALLKDDGKEGQE